jgi:hypothetical protein
LIEGTENGGDGKGNLKACNGCSRCFMRVIATSVLYSGQRWQQLSQGAVAVVYWHNVSEDDLIRLLSLKTHFYETLCCTLFAVGRDPVSSLF